MSTFSEIMVNRRLATEVEKHPCLYNNLERGHVDRKDAAWKEIAEVLNVPDLTARVCEKKWGVLRSAYVKGLKEGNDKHIIPEMKFLIPHLKISDPLVNAIFSGRVLVNSTQGASSEISDASMHTETGSDISMKTKPDTEALETNGASSLSDDNQIVDVGTQQALTTDDEVEISHDAFNAGTSGAEKSCVAKKRKLEWMDHFHDSIRHQLQKMDDEKQLEYMSKVIPMVNEILKDNVPSK